MELKCHRYEEADVDFLKCILSYKNNIRYGNPNLFPKDKDGMKSFELLQLRAMQSTI